MNFQEIKDPISTIEQVEEQSQADSQFYTQLFKKEEEYKAKPSQRLLEELIKLYSDCIQYFDMKTEGVSNYFQHKLKKLMLNKRKMDKQIVYQKQLQQNVTHVPITQQIKDHKESLGKYKQKVTSIIDQQKQILAERRMNKRKPMSLGSAFTVSMDSLFQSPQRSSVRSRFSSKAKLFQSLIDDQDQDNQSEKLSN